MSRLDLIRVCLPSAVSGQNHESSGVTRGIDEKEVLRCREIALLLRASDV